MTVEKFIKLCVDGGMVKFSIYDIEIGKTVWRGYGHEDLPEQLARADVESYDVPTKEYELCLNVQKW